VEEHKDASTGRVYYTPKREVEPYINDWMSRKIWLYDNKIIDTDERKSIIERFTAAYKQYDCRVFVVDNLMTVNCNSSARDIMQVQAEFVIRLRKFAQVYGVHVHIVVHPRKSSEVADSDDVGGMGTITNIACNVYSIRREVKENEDKTFVRCLKNRAFGVRGEVELLFDERGRRFSEPLGQPVVYGWAAGKDETA
jgi:twinkle protein